MGARALEPRAESAQPNPKNRGSSRLRPSNQAERSSVESFNNQRFWK